MSRRKSDKEHELAGNPGKKGEHKRPDLPSNLDAMPTCPDWLAAEAKAEWKRLGPMLHNAGLLKLVDRAAFTVLCSSIGHLRRIDAELAKADIVTTGSMGQARANPLHSLRAQYAEQIRRMCGEFGLTPASRYKVGSTEPLRDPDPMESLLSQTKPMWKAPDSK